MVLLDQVRRLLCRCSTLKGVLGMGPCKSIKLEELKGSIAE